MEGNKRRIALFVMSAIAVATACFFGFSKTVQAEFTSHIIINEIQTAGINSSNDEFIELFNPTSVAIVLDGYKLSKKTKSGTESVLVSTSVFSGIIQAHGYFLIAHPTFKEIVSADLAYSSSSYYISNDNTVFLYNKNGEIIDKVGFGATPDFENYPAPNPPAGKSIGRNNFLDTDDNLADFSIYENSSPYNSNIIESYNNSDNNIPKENNTTNNENEASNGEGNENLLEDIHKGNDNDTQDSSDACATVSTEIKLNEIFPFPSNNGNEFVEITNIGNECVDMSSWIVMDETNHKKLFPKNSIIKPGEYLYLEGNLYLNNGSDTVYLLNSTGSTKADAVDQISYEKAPKNASFNRSNNGSWFWSLEPSPGEENIFPPPDNNGVDDEIFPPMSNLHLNEILPNPKGEEKTDEYVEVMNNGNEATDLYGWTIRDNSKTGKFVFKEHIIIEPGGYFVIYRPQSKISLNNGAETVYLVNPAGVTVSSTKYDKAPQNVSYNFDGAIWKWSKFLTPGKENEFDSPPKLKIDKIKTAYKNTYVKFSASARDKETKKLKYKWDFGDGKKSYLQQTSHKYLNEGKYKVTISVTDESQAIEKNFTLKVQKYPRPDLEIVKLLPNPAGKDTEEETIDIKNNSKKKIDLREWKIATGSNTGKTYSHPISKEFFINSGELKTITREFSKFSLNNKSGKVQLVFPDGKIADKVEYEKQKIADNETYVKLNDEWIWIKSSEPNTDNENKKEVVFDEDDDTTDKENEDIEEGEVLGATDTIAAPYKAGFSPEDAYIFLSQLNFLKPVREMSRASIFNPPFSFAWLIAATL